MPYFEQSNRRAYTLKAFGTQSTDFAANRLYLLYDRAHHVASVFSCETEFDQKQLVPFSEAVMGDQSMIKALPAATSTSHMLLLTEKHVVLF